VSLSLALAREEEFHASVRIAVDIGKRLGTKAFNALYGTISPAPDQDDMAVSNLATPQPRSPRSAARS